MATSNVTNLTNVKELGDGGTDGTRLGKTSASLISFHGSTPVDQYTTITLATSATIATVIARVQSILAMLREKGLIAT
jgi:hypothetical protein